MKTKSFWVFVGLYFLTRLPWLFMVPMVEAPDEFSHFWVIQFVIDHLRLPEYQEIIAGGPSGVYGSLPQLGYFPHVIAGSLGHLVAPGADLSLTERFGSLFTGLALLWCSFEFGKKLFGADKILSTALPLMIIFHPQLVLLHSYANSDSTTASLSAVILLITCRMMEAGLKTRTSLILGLLLGWIVLTKYPGVSVYPSCAIGFIAAAWLNKQGLKTFLIQAFTALATTAAASVWWFWRSAKILDGDFMGTKTMFHTWAVTYNKALNPDISVSKIIKDYRWWRLTTWSYWGMFGYMTRKLGNPFYYTFEAFSYIAAVGALVSLIVAAVKGKLTTFIQSLKDSASYSAEQRQALLGKAGVWLVLAACFITNVALMVYASTKNLGGAQGRYLFPSEIPIMALLLGGLSLTGKKPGKCLVLLLVAFTIAMYFYSCWMLSHTPGYYPHLLKTY